MRKLALAAITTIAFVGSSFASNEVVETTEMKSVETVSSFDGDSVDSLYKTQDCLLTITIYFEDGSTEVRYILVKGASCEEILGPSKSTTITPSKTIAP